MTKSLVFCQLVFAVLLNTFYWCNHSNWYEYDVLCLPFTPAIKKTLIVLIGFTYQNLIYKSLDIYD